MSLCCSPPLPIASHQFIYLCIVMSYYLFLIQPEWPFHRIRRSCYFFAPNIPRVSLLIQNENSSPHSGGQVFTSDLGSSSLSWPHLQGLFPRITGPQPPRDLCSIWSWKRYFFSPHTQGGVNLGLSWSHCPHCWWLCFRIEVSENNFSYLQPTIKVTLTIR